MGKTKINAVFPAVNLQVSGIAPKLPTNVSVQIKKPIFEEGQVIDNKYCVRKKINEGGFGAIYQITIEGQSDTQYAMKLALMKDAGMDQLVKMEIGLLRRLSKQSVCFPKFHSSGIIEGYRYLVMDLLGPSLADVQSYMQDERFSISTTIRTGLQLIDAIEVIHSCFFVHRDIKPGNMAIGYKKPRQIHLFDFGLARRFVQKVYASEKLDFRPERTKAPFRGTYHYCSLQQHKFRDACRRDDLWAFMYTLIEFITGSLPWEHERDKVKIQQMKQDTPLSILLQGCPLIFEALLKYLDKLEFKSRPSYDFFRQAFRLLIKARNYSESDPFDWEEIDSKNAHSTRKPKSVSAKAVYDRGDKDSKPSDNTDISSSEMDTNASNRTIE